jgi:hypothetical protein
MKYIKLFENFSEAPKTITVKFYGDGFMNHYWNETPGDKVYQSHGWASNLKNLQGEGHHTYGDGGLEMRKGYYYPLFKENKENSFWYYIVYSGDEINIIQSSEHSNQGVDIPNYFNSLKAITHNWYCKFDNGVIPGEKDHRGFFRIVSVK